MRCLLLYFLLTTIYVAKVSPMKNDYYWRDYTGDIPIDAIKGGRDVNNETTYIGQVYVKQYGIIPVMIYPGKKSVVANIWGLHKTESYIKILCGSGEDNFKWIPASAANLHLVSINKHLVRGGVEYNLVTNIGRVAYQNEVVVGKVCGFNIGNAKMFFPGKTKEENVGSYEVLIYEPKPRWVPELA